MNMNNPIGFGKKQREPLELRVEYDATKNFVSCLVWVEINGARFTLTPDRRRAKAFYRLMYERLGDRRYEQ